MTIGILRGDIRTRPLLRVFSEKDLSIPFVKKKFGSIRVTDICPSGAPELLCGKNDGLCKGSVL
jgi:hypothetical protein